MIAQLHFCNIQIHLSISKGNVVRINNDTASGHSDVDGIGYIDPVTAVSGRMHAAAE